MTASQVTWPILSSRRCGFSSRFLRPGVVGRCIRLAMVSIIILGPGSPASAGRGGRGGPSGIDARARQAASGGRVPPGLPGRGRRHPEPEAGGRVCRDVRPARARRPPYPHPLRPQESRSRGCRPPLPGPRRLRDHRILYDRQGRRAHPRLRARGGPLGRDRYADGRGGDHRAWHHPQGGGAIHLDPDLRALGGPQV